jgi:hypothetical protein
MADGDVDISGMPDPSAIGLSPVKQVDPADSMPEPAALFKKYYGYVPPTQLALDTFMKNPPDMNEKRPSLKETASALTGIPRAVAGYAAAVPAGVASVAGQGVGALGAAIDPTNAAAHLEQGRERGREWSADVNNLANYVPATQGGAKLANDLMSAPAGIIKEVGDTTLGKVLPDNAYQAVSDVARDVGTDLPALGAPGVARGVARAGAKAAGAVKAKIASEAATLTPPAPEAPLTPPVGQPITGDTLRTQPNPIPAPEGTVHRTATEQGHSPAAPPEPEPAASAAAGTPSPGDIQRGSVRLFSSPAEEGPKETPAPDQQSERAGHLDAIDKLSGGQLPTRRSSALSGDYNKTGDDWQMKEVGDEGMRKQIASENSAMHTATDNVHDSVGSAFPNSVDSTTLGDRGRVTRGAIQGIEGWFGKATDQLYDTAREQNQGRPMPTPSRVSAYLNDDSNFTNDAEIGLQRAAKQRMERLWSTGDPDKNTPPGSVNAAERLREFLNEKGKNPQAMGVASEMKNHLDMDVAEQGGPGLFQAARSMRRHSYQMLEEPAGIKKLLTPGDSQGINHAIPEHKVMDYIADLPREQHEHVLNVLRAGAHLGGGELANGSAAAIREIQAHTISRIHAAATNADGTWNARKFYNAADRYARNAPETFKNRPDVVQNLKTINDAGNTLHMDKHYPGAGAQIERTGMVGHALETGGNLVASLAHDVPIVGRYIGRSIENAAAKAAGKATETSRAREVQSRLIARNGKQLGAVGDLGQRENNVTELPTSATPTEREALNWRKDNLLPNIKERADAMRAKVKQFADEGQYRFNPGDRIKTPSGSVMKIDSHSISGEEPAYNYTVGDPNGQGDWQQGTALQSRMDERYQKLGGPIKEVQSRLIARNGKQLGAVGDLSQREQVTRKSAKNADGTVDHMYTVPGKSQMDPGGSLVAREYPERGVTQVMMSAVKNKGQGWGTQMLAKAADDTHARGQVLHSDQQVSGGGGTGGQAGSYNNLKKLGYNVTTKDYDNRGGAMHAVGDHVFEVHPGAKTKVPESQRGSVQLFNDNALNRSTTRRTGKVERNPRSEYNANRAIAGNPVQTNEREDILRRLSY